MSMKSEVLSNFTTVILPATGFILFFSIFIGAIIWVYRPKSQTFYKKLAKLALEDNHND